jgi:hypothetical protein
LQKPGLRLGWDGALPPDFIFQHTDNRFEVFEVWDFGDAGGQLWRDILRAPRQEFGEASGHRDGGLEVGEVLLLAPLLLPPYSSAALEIVTSTLSSTLIDEAAESPHVVM